jgi:nicotinamidase-related amidase
MTTLDPRTTALLVMDVQNGILGRLPDPDSFLDVVERAVSTAREAGAHVGYVRVAFADADLADVPAHSAFAGILADDSTRAAMHADAPTTAVHDRVTPRDGDLVVRKTRVGPFSTTDLAQQLADRGVTTLVLAGLSTSGVVLSTVRHAADHDYRLVVLSDAVTDTDPEVHRVLIEKVIPRQAQVVTTADLAGLLGLSRS